MAAYGALVSLTHTVEKINHHPFPPITLNQELVQPIIDKVAFLQHFLENYPNTNLAYALESRIAIAAVAAQDIILSRIQAIHGGSTSQGETITSTHMHQVLQKVLRDLQSISTEVVEIKENADSSRSTRDDSSSSSFPKKQNIVVGLEDAVDEIMDKLTGELPCYLLAIPIVGMGGIGKSTLANTVYTSQLIIQHFDIRARVTLSVEFNVREVFLQLLLSENSSGSREKLSELDEHELGHKLFQMLCWRRYFIVLDDLWSFEAWEEISSFFPDNDNGSRIMITTRLSNVASQFINSHVHEMKFLNEEKSWDLFCKYVFRKDESCPLELEETGKLIARNCGGLPLAIVVIGSLLAKSQKSLEYWEFIAENLSSSVNLMDNERCLQVLHTSYTQLHVHLKPCFLYLAIYPQNSLIRVSRLIMAWVAKGFLRPISGKSLEIVAEDYLGDLIERNLLIVCKLASNGETKFFKLHDLLRDLCLREAEKEKFLRFATRCSFGIHQSTMKEDYYPDAMSLYRPFVMLLTPRYEPAPDISTYLSLLLRLRFITQHRVRERTEGLPDPLEDIFWKIQFVTTRHLPAPEVSTYISFLSMLRLITPPCRVTERLEGVFGHVNLQYLAMFGSQVQSLSTFPSPISLLWNLQTLIVEHSGTLVLAAPNEVWNMPQLRHVMFGKFYLSDPPPRDDSTSTSTSTVVLENLQTLCRVHNFKWSEEVVKRIPNLKKLKVYYDVEIQEGSKPDYYIHNIGCLNRLESLSCTFDTGDYLPQHLTFPHSLKKLTLEGILLQREDMKTAIGSLPHLQVLKLRFCLFEEAVWETDEGQFCSLKFLVMDTCVDLESWITYSSHFPCLERLVLRDMEKFEKIPSEIGDIPTQQYIEMDRCSDSAVISAKEIIEEQEGNGNEELRIRVKLWKVDKELLSLASHNFVIHA